MNRIAQLGTLPGFRKAWSCVYSEHAQICYECVDSCERKPVGRRSEIKRGMTMVWILFLGFLFTFLFRMVKSFPNITEGIVKQILFIALIWAFPAICYAGAWSLKEGQLFNELVTNYYSAKEDFDESGNLKQKPNNGKYSEQRMELKFDYGYSDSTDILFYTPIKQAKYDDDNISINNSGIVDIGLGVKRVLWYSDKKYSSYVASLLAMAKFSVYDEDDQLALGTGEDNYE